MPTLPPSVPELIQLLNDGETVTLEAKASGIRLSRDLWTTLSALANTLGGHIILGVSEDESGRFVPTGVTSAHNQVTAFFNQQNNRQKFSAEVCGNDDVHIVEHVGLSFIVLEVPMVDRKQRPVYVGQDPLRGTYKRRHDGDYQCEEQEVRIMLREGADLHADAVLLDDYTLDDLDHGSLKSYRQRFQNANPDHAFNNSDDREFLIDLGAYAVDRRTRKEGLTVAGLLLFGRQRAIREWRGRQFIDFQYRETLEQDRWDDRVVWESNLFGAFFKIYPELVRGLRVPFEMRADGTRRKLPPEHEALQEALVNLLVHADYQETATSLITRDPDGYRFTNPGNSRVRDLLTAKRKVSEPRNPTILSAFRYIGLADEAGSGIKAIKKAWKALGLINPIIDLGIDDYTFDLRLRHTHILSDAERNWLAALEDVEAVEEQQLALLLARREGRIDNATLCHRSGCHPSDATKALIRLRDLGHLVKEGDRRGSWYHLGASAQAMWADSSSAHSDGASPDKQSDKEGELSHKASSSTDKPSDKAFTTTDMRTAPPGREDTPPHGSSELSDKRAELSDKPSDRQSELSDKGEKGATDRQQLPVKQSVDRSPPMSFTGTDADWDHMLVATQAIRQQRRAANSTVVPTAVLAIAKIHAVSASETAYLLGKSESYAKEVISKLVKAGYLKPLQSSRTHPQQRYIATDPNQTTLPFTS